MIALLRGDVAAVDDEACVIDTGGVGYSVSCHSRTLGRLRDSRGPVTLHVHTAVSDDAIRLYGFDDADELRLFRLLIGVERIGPKAGLAILGRADLQTLARALRDSDAALLATVPGVGRKTAERLVLELRDKVEWLALPGEAAPAALGQGDAAVAALTGLGFREAQARSAVAAVRHDAGDGDVNALVAAALRHIDEVGAAS